MNFIEFIWNFPYIRWHICFILLPSIVIWLFYWRYLIRYKKTILFITLIGFPGALFAEILGSTILRIWYYNPAQHLGPFILGLPLGEYIFMLFFPQFFVSLLLIVRKELYK